MIRLAGVLTVICVIAALVLGAVNQVTRPKIIAYQKQKVQLAKQAVLPAADSFMPAGPVTEKFIYYEGVKNNHTVGFVCEATIQGFSGDLKFMVGFTPELQVTGLMPLEHKETPGLGARIDEIKPSISAQYKENNPAVDVSRPWFCEQFKGKTPAALHLGADGIDAITAATITSRAVTKGAAEVIATFTKLRGAKK